jgi:hypothetical protein
MENEMSGVYSMNGRDKKCIQNISEKNLNGRDHLEDLWWIVTETGWEGMD